MWKLVIEDDEGKRTVVPLTRDRYSIGRKEGNTIRLTERNVSREHARIVRSPRAGPPKFILEDLSSHNGVFVNGLRIGDPQELANGDLVQIGDYRIVLDGEAPSIELSPTAVDPKQTLPPLGQARASTLLDRPNRLVMLAGPTPGSEYPLDRERMTIGRAEETNVSVNHNSVSRLHCEVHDLGDGRFEIVDKGSANGVRVNGSDLRRGIIEPGDVIELGDVKFKFIGAGQIFRPAENAPLAVLEDRSAEEIAARRRAANALPMGVCFLVVAVGAVAAWVLTRPSPAQPYSSQKTTVPTTEGAPSADREALDAAIKLYAAGDYEGAHSRLEAVTAESALRSAREYKSIENGWADKLVSQAEDEPDVTKKRAILQRVSQSMSVDPARRKTAADEILALDTPAATSVATPSQLPVASDHPYADGTIAVAHPDTAHRGWPTNPSAPAPSGPGAAARNVKAQQQP